LFWVTMLAIFAFVAVKVAQMILSSLTAQDRDEGVWEFILLSVFAGLVFTFVLFWVTEIFVTEAGWTFFIGGAIYTAALELVSYIHRRFMNM